MAFFKKRQSSSASQTKETYSEPLPESQIKRATRTRYSLGWFTSFCLFVTVVFMIIVEIGDTYNIAVLRDIWFIRLDLSDVVPASVPNAVLLNSIAETLGLHDYYYVGLWNYCEGYLDQPVTHCTTPHTLYWFNPVQIIASQLIAGASIQLPTEIGTVLNIIRIASHVMFGLFLAGACFSFVLMFFMVCTVYSRWVSALLTVLTFLNALMITAASVIATVLFVIIRDVFVSNTDVNIGATIGITMFVCMWFASAFAIIAWLFQFGMCCCCASRRDVRTGRKKGAKKAYSQNSSDI